MIQIPKDGYWHCKIMIDKNTFPIYLYDKSFYYLNENIVKFYRQNKEFVIDGHRIENREKIKYIKIVHSDQKYITYGIEKKYYFDFPLVFENGKDFTNDLLHSEEYDVFFKEINKSNDNSSNTNTININNINQQQQMQSQSQQISIEKIIELQDTFAELRKELKTNKNIDCEEMKETQDALDELSQNSPTEQKNKAFTKLRRFINTVSSVIDKTSKAFELFEKLKKIYNYIAPVIGLMLI